MELYIVRPGDSLSAIAKSHGTSPEALVRRNQLGDPRRLCPGLSLVLEGKAEAAPAGTELCAARSPPGAPPETRSYATAMKAPSRRPSR